MEEHGALIKELMKQNFKDSNTKINKDGLRAYCHFLELFIQEGAIRAQNRAKFDGSTNKTIEFEHLEQVFAQLLLDF